MMDRLLQNLALGKRLALVVGVLVVLVLAGTGVGLWGMSQAKESLRAVHEEQMIPAVQLSEIERLLTENRRLLAEAAAAMASADDKLQQVAADNAAGVGKNQAEVASIWKNYASGHLDADERKLATAFETALAAHVREAEGPALEALRRFDVTKMRETMKQAEARTGVAARTALLPLIGHQVELAQREYDAAAARFQRSWIGLSAAVALGLVLALWISRTAVLGITRPLEYAIVGIQGMAKGDLTYSFKRGGKDEMAWMYYELHSMQKGLRTLVGSVMEDAQQVSSAAAHLNGAAGQITAASRHQSEAVSSTAAAVEEMTVSINHIAEHAGEAARVAHEAHELAHGGQSIVRNASGQVSAIEKAVSESGQLIDKLRTRSEEIGRIVQAIQGIAEQTNLLALNAAIEAARAGEQGRGFAVVADEVRQLAGHTSQATSEIERMIASIQSETRQAVEVMQRGNSQVQEGVRLADAAAQSLEQISEGSQRTAGTVNEIATATDEQRAASSEIARNVERIAQMAEENNAAVQETAAAAHDLEELAARLRGRVESFRL